MARLRQNQRERAIGMLTAGMSQALNVHATTIARLWRRYNDTGRATDRPRAQSNTFGIFCIAALGGVIHNQQQQQLTRALVEEWDRIFQPEIQRFINSMHRGFQGVDARPAFCTRHNISIKAYYI